MYIEYIKTDCNFFGYILMVLLIQSVNILFYVYLTFGKEVEVSWQ